MEKVFGVYEAIKSWLYKCSSMILVICFLKISLPKVLVLIATWSIIAIFATDIFAMVAGFVHSIKESEWSALGVSSSIIGILTLVGSIIIYFFGVSVLEEIGIFTELGENFGKLQWAAMCVVIWHFAEEILSLPESILAIFTDDGDF